MAGRNVAVVAEAGVFLRDQHPPAPDLTPEQQESVRREVERLLEEWRERPVDHTGVARELDEQRGRVGRMVSFLDRCPVPPATGQTP